MQADPLPIGVVTAAFAAVVRLQSPPKRTLLPPAELDADK